MEIIKDLARREGFRGFYRGLSANLIGVTPEKAIKLTVNDTVRTMIARKRGVSSRDLSPFDGMLAGAAAGICQCLATNPMEMVKINLQLPHQGRQTITEVVRTLGLRGMYRGSSATLMRDVPFSMIFFQSFASLSESMRKRQNAEKLGMGSVLVAGFAAGSFGAVLATPMDLVKTRYQSEWFQSQLQGSMTCRSVGQIWKGTIRNEGVSALFKGSLQRCMIVGPLFGISLMSYEVFNRFI